MGHNFTSNYFTSFELFALNWYLRLLYSQMPSILCAKQRTSSSTIKSNLKGHTKASLQHVGTFYNRITRSNGTGIS